MCGERDASKEKIVIVSKERDVRTHANLWHTSRCLLERGQEQERASFHQFMASLVFTAFTLEAYLNWLGDKLFPHWNYLGRLNPKEKLAVISDRLKVEVDSGRRPWQTLKPLFGFRNDIAHGKPETVTTESTEPNDDYLDEKLGRFARTDWEKFCTRENAERAREDIAEIVGKLHAAANLKEEPDPFIFGFQSASAVLSSSPAPRPLADSAE